MVDSQTLGVLTTLALGVAVAFIATIVFVFLRPKFPTVYEHRRHLNRIREYNDFNGARVGFPSKLPGSGLFGWIGPTLATPEDEVVSRIGLDAAMFIRFLRSQALALGILSAVCCLILWPTYGTASNKSLPEADASATRGLQVISLSNVPIGDSRLWATLILEYVTAAVVLYFLFRDYKIYSEYRRSYRNSDNPANYSVVVHDIPRDENSEEQVRERFELMLPNQVSEVAIARKCAAAAKLEKRLAKTIAQKERAEYLRDNSDKEPMHRPGMCGALMCWKAKVPSVEYFTEEMKKLEDELHQKADAAPRSNGAVVVFKNKRAASLIAQANQGANADEWIVDRAGEPEGMHWPALHIPSYQAVWRAAAVLVFVFLLTFFWLIPATAIAGLASLERLSEVPAFEWVDRIQDLSPGVVGLIENVLPALVISIFLGLIPTFIRLAVMQQRIHGWHIIEAKTRNYFYFFTIFANFLFIVLGSTILSQLDAIRQKPEQITELLAKGVAGRGLVFVSFIIVQTFIPLAIGLLNPGRLIIRGLKVKLAKTMREKRVAEETGNVFQYFKHYGVALTIALMGTVYSTLAPLVTLAAFIHFAYSYLVHKYNIIYASHRKWDGGGWDYPGAFWAAVVGLILKQLSMIGVLGLYEGAAQTTLALIPLVVTIIFAVWCNRRFSRVSLHGSLHDQYAEGSTLDEIPQRYKGLYRQPGVSPKEYINLSGAGVDTMYDYPDEDADGFDKDADIEHAK